MPSIQDIIEKYRPELEEYESLYKHYHANPELSFVEKETAEHLVSHLKTLVKKYDLKDDDYTLNTSIGGHGTAFTLRNGEGQTILLRADIDGLPVEEKTGRDYASKKRMKDADGIEQPCMHACGHDMHIASLLGAAELLFAARETWSGTLLLIFQPAEEKGGGAQAMVDDGLYSKKLAPVPDIAVGAHVFYHKVGTLGTRSRNFMSAADSMKITLHGHGGHSSAPHMTKDPVTLAAYVITRLQSIVSREVAPATAKSITVSSVHAGYAENVIPEFAELKLNVRTWSEKVREFVLSRIHKVVDAESVAHDAPKSPTYETLSKFPLTYNDEEVTAKLSESMKAHFGDKWDDEIDTLPGSEDFSILASSVGKPSTYFIYGGMDPEVWRKSEEEDGHVPMNHSAYFSPEIQPTLTYAVDAYSVAALTWLKKS